MPDGEAPEVEKSDKFLSRPTAVVALVGGIVAIIASVVGLVVALRPSPTPAPGPDTSAAAVASCMSQHGLSATRKQEKIPPNRAEYSGCSWPAPPGADGDGFFQITVVDEPGPGQSEAEGMTNAQTFTSDCQHLELTYRFFDQGNFVPSKPFILAKGDIVRVEDGSVWHPANSTQATDFQLSVNQSMVMSNGRYELDAAQCT